MTAALAAVDRGELRSGGTETFASYPIPALGHRRLTAISPGHLRKLVADLAASNSIASKTINNAVVPLRLVLAHAVEDGLIPSNPAATTAGGLAGLLLASGLRIGEALALQWSDVALEHGAITSAAH